jgi:hypothetical protein
MKPSVGLCTFAVTELTRRSQPKGHALTRNGIRLAVRRAAVVVALGVASLGVAAGPAEAKPVVCKSFFAAFKWAQAGFMAAYEAWDEPGMNFWLKEYGDLIDAAIEAGCEG